MMISKEKDKIKTLFENVGIYTASDNKVSVLLKGVGDFEIPCDEHGMSPSYISGLQYAYQYFKSKGKELDFQDLIDLEGKTVYINVPEIAKNGLIKLLNNEKLDIIHQGLNAIADWHYLEKNDDELKFLYISSKILGNKSTRDLEGIKEKLEHSLWDGGFIDEFEWIFRENLDERWYGNDHETTHFANELFEAIKKDKFVTSINRDEFDISDGFRGNEYIKVLQGNEKYRDK